MIAEVPLAFYCEGDRLVGVLHRSERPFHRGILIVVGGPQYRVGSHRQFVLLARSLAKAHISTLRFDYRGIGDSEGDVRTFEEIDTDIRAAIDTFLGLVPELKEVVIWGLCDAASAALLYAHTDERVSGVVLLNPWVRTEAGIAKTYLRHYYRRRIIDPNFWRKLSEDRFDFAAALKSLMTTTTAALRSNSRPNSRQQTTATNSDTSGSEHVDTLFLERMLDGLKRFGGRVLLVLSGDDLTSREFKDMLSGAGRWRKLLNVPRVTRHDLPGANHTFSRRGWHDQVANWTEEWIKSW